MNCAAKGKIVGNGLLVRTNSFPHNHQNHQLRADYESAFQLMREMVRDSPDREVKDIHKEVVRGLSLEVSGYLEWENCRLTLQRIKNRDNTPCRNLLE